MRWELRMGGGWPGVICDIGGRPGQLRGGQAHVFQERRSQATDQGGAWGCRTAHSMLRYSEIAGSRVAVSQGQAADQAEGHSWGPGRCL